LITVLANNVPFQRLARTHERNDRVGQLLGNTLGDVQPGQQMAAGPTAGEDNVGRKRDRHGGGSFKAECSRRRDRLNVECRKPNDELMTNFQMASAQRPIWKPFEPFAHSGFGNSFVILFSTFAI
jgi:hypothetical protein